MILILFHSALLVVVVSAADVIFAVEDNRGHMKRHQLVAVAVLAVMSVYPLGIYLGFSGLWHMGSIALLFIAAVEDALTGYVYDLAGISFLIVSMLFALGNWPTKWETYEIKLLFMLLSLWIAFTAFGWMGTGDLPLLIGLMLYYIAFCEEPMYALIFMYLVSQLAYAVFAVILRKKALPLVPALYIAHVFALIIWA